jgi:hypothetical protein
MASSAPATSAKVTVGVSFVTSFARDLPNCMTLLLPPWAAEEEPEEQTQQQDRDEQREQALEEGGARDDVVEAVLRGRGIHGRDDLGARADVVELHLLAPWNGADRVMSTRWSPSVFVTW